MSTEIVLIGIETRSGRGGVPIPRVADEIGDLGVSNTARELEALADAHPDFLWPSFTPGMRYQYLVRDIKGFEQLMRSLFLQGAIHENNWAHAFESMKKNFHLTWWIHIED